jgi:hypothetical protein
MTIIVPMVTKVVKWPASGSRARLPRPCRAARGGAPSLG